MSVRSMLNSTCDVFTLTTGQSGMGGVTETYSATARLKDEPCRIRELSSDERVMLGREGVNSTHRIYFRGGTTINDTDKITNIKTYKRRFLTSTDTKAYDVNSKPNDVDRMQRLVQVDLVLRD